MRNFDEAPDAGVNYNPPTEDDACTEDDRDGEDYDSETTCAECGLPTGDRIAICDECSMFGPPTRFDCDPGDGQ